MGLYQGCTEEIDTAENKCVALYLQNEYAVAYGKQWIIFIKESKDRI